MNIFEQISLYFKIKALWKGVNKMSWKTTLFGILAVLPQLWQLLMPSLNLPQPIVNAISGIMGAIAFYFAKDKNVTGGTVK